MEEVKSFIKDYFEQKKVIQNALLEYLQDTCEPEVSFYLFTKILEKQKIQNDRQELEHFLQLLLTIANNIHRTEGFSNKIERILQFLTNDLKLFSNNELIEIFIENKLIFYLLLKNKFIMIDKTNFMYLFDSGLPSYRHFFYPEIKEFISGEDKKEVEYEIIKFENINPENIEYIKEKRMEGENASYLCSLIRNDSIDEFISHVSKNSISLSSKIKPSIFETNPFLSDKQASLIEYSAFFGSIQIFNFLFYSQADIQPTIWLYSIHSNNAELIHLLEQNQNDADESTIEHIYFESIKCHHNSIANYISDQNNLRYINSTQLNKEEIYNNFFKYFYYSFFPTEFNINDIFYCFAKYNYTTIINSILKIRAKSIEDAINDKTNTNYNSNNDDNIIRESATKNDIITVLLFIIKREYHL